MSTSKKATTVKRVLNNDERKAVKSAANAEQTAQPGIIAFIMSQLLVARDKGTPLTVAKLVTNLSKRFPHRAASGMRITVTAQLSRLPREREFPIDKVRDGRNVLYSAGKKAAIPTA